MATTINFHHRRLVVADEWMAATIQLAEKAARTEAPVLLTGESGTGKELIARFIHEKSRRNQGPFVSVNCAAIPEGLLEAEFFGYERGAFTGAVAQKIGKFEKARGGTLLLDEISEMPFFLQAKLLRVLQENELDRLGGKDAIPLDCRIIATTNRDPVQLIRENKFRDDLYFRLNVIRVDCQPLRGRTGAIRSLAGNFLTQAGEKFGFESPGFSASALDRLCEYEWPGNVRELSNAVDRAVVLAEGDTIRPEHLVGLTSIRMAPMQEEPGMQSLAALERKHIERTLKMTQGHQEQAASLLGISSRTLRNKLKTYLAE